jgi:hypothetical protein
MSPGRTEHLFWLASMALSAILSCSGNCPAQTAATKADNKGLAVSSPASSEQSAFLSPKQPESPWAALIGEAARRNDLPVDFLTQLLRRESSLFDLAVSPAGAQGIAQFMPRTASVRGLDDPFDPKKAIPAAASYLGELRRQFGNLGLAAAAYNGGPGRVTDWLNGTRELPAETRDYVMLITGRSALDWAGVKNGDFAVNGISGRPAETRKRSSKIDGKNKPSPEAQLCAAFKESAKGCILQTVY